MPELYAHTRRCQDGSVRWQSLEGHLHAAAEYASAFADKFQSAEWGWISGFLHDVGKAHPAFQGYLRRENGLEASEFDDDSGGRVNHSGVGAIIGMNQWPGPLGKALAYVIAGHHAGLPNWHGGQDALSHRIESERANLDAIRERDKWRNDLVKTSLKLPACSMACSNGLAIAYHFWVRMLYSCLVDADFLDTERFMSPERTASRPVFPTLADLKRGFDREMDRMMNRAKEEDPGKKINEIRSSILHACRESARRTSGLFSLTVPTGGGKTLSGTAFALDHAVIHGKRRIIYVIPYTSIIEQTADVLRRFFGAENVVEHHSNLSPERERERPELALAAENWDAPVIVTTNVQFFESLYAAKPGRCRKLHNIVESVVILDEAQLLPPKWLIPCVEAINRLVLDFGVSVVLSTATQPALDSLCTQPAEIVPNPGKLYENLKRTDIQFPEDVNQRRAWEELAQEISGHERVLCIVNKRKDCYDLWRAMPEGTIHLSALMCGAHRSKIIRTIKERLKDDGPVRVVSTQLVEAGVDLDFPVVYRALAGLDSINQAAGRCNREGSLDCLGKVVVFVPPEPSPPGLLRKGESATRVLASMPGFQPDHPDSFRMYFQKLYGDVNDLGREWLIENLVRNANPDGHVQFRTAGDEFRLIDEYAVPVVVRYDGNDDLIDALRYGGLGKETMRALQRYVVNLSRAHAQRMQDVGFVECLHDSILVQIDSTLYSENVGLDIHRQQYLPEDLFI